jgi:septal ring factor EnvC (AmiA/AmiB activator)
MTEEEESRQQLERERDELRDELASQERETLAYRQQAAHLEEELGRLRRTMEAELELQRARHADKLEQILEELAGSTLRFSRFDLQSIKKSYNEHNVCCKREFIFI